MHAGGTLRQLISIALQNAPNIAADTVINLPKSADEEKWDIIAKMPVTGEGAPQIVHGQRQSPLSASWRRCFVVFWSKALK